MSHERAGPKSPCTGQGHFRSPRAGSGNRRSQLSPPPGRHRLRTQSRTSPPFLGSWGIPGPYFESGRCRRWTRSRAAQLGLRDIIARCQIDGVANAVGPVLVQHLDNAVEVESPKSRPVARTASPPPLTHTPRRSVQQEAGVQHRRGTKHTSQPPPQPPIIAKTSRCHQGSAPTRERALPHRNAISSTLDSAGSGTRRYPSVIWKEIGQGRPQVAHNDDPAS